MEIAAAGASLQAAYVTIQQPTDAAEARRVAQAIASNQSLKEPNIGKLGLVVTEVGRNLIKHAGGGDLFLRALQSGDRRGVKILAVDQGPGIADWARSFRDGFSTAKMLAPAEQARLRRYAAGVLPKSALINGSAAAELQRICSDIGLGHLLPGEKVGHA